LTLFAVRRNDDHIRVRSLIIPLVLVGIAVKLVQVAATRNGVGPMEYLTLAALVLFLLLTAFRLSRRALGRA
jgi:hypothetical protein